MDSDEDLLTDLQYKDNEELEDLDDDAENALLGDSDDEGNNKSRQSSDFDKDTKNNIEYEYVDEDGNPVDINENDEVEYIEVTQDDADCVASENDDVLDLLVETDLDFDDGVSVTDIVNDHIKRSFGENAAAKLYPTREQKQQRVQQSQSAVQNAAKNERTCESPEKQSTSKHEESLESTTESEMLVDSSGIKAESSESEDEENTGRGRFRTERPNIVHLSAAKKRANIPDSLDVVVSYEEASKLERSSRQFKRREPMRGMGRGGERQRGGDKEREKDANRESNRSHRNESQCAQKRGLPHRTTRSHLESPESRSSGASTITISSDKSDSSVTDMRHTKSASAVSNNETSGSRKILINPHFKGPVTSAPQDKASSWANTSSAGTSFPTSEHHVGRTSNFIETTNQPPHSSPFNPAYENQTNHPPPPLATHQPHYNFNPPLLTKIPPTPLPEPRPVPEFSVPPPELSLPGSRPPMMPAGGPGNAPLMNMYPPVRQPQQPPPLIGNADPNSWRPRLDSGPYGQPHMNDSWIPPPSHQQHFNNFNAANVPPPSFSPNPSWNSRMPTMPSPRPPLFGNLPEPRLPNFTNLQEPPPPLQRPPLLHHHHQHLETRSPTGFPNAGGQFCTPPPNFPSMDKPMSRPPVPMRSLLGPWPEHPPPQRPPLQFPANFSQPPPMLMGNMTPPFEGNARNIMPLLSTGIRPFEVVNQQTNIRCGSNQQGGQQWLKRPAGPQKILLRKRVRPNDMNMLQLPMKQAKMASNLGKQIPSNRRKPLQVNSNITEVKIVDKIPPELAAPTNIAQESTSSSQEDPSEEDEETRRYRLQIELQKKKREETLRIKEQRRIIMAQQRRSLMLKEQQTKQQQQQQQQQQSPPTHLRVTEEPGNLKQQQLPAQMVNKQNIPRVSAISRLYRGQPLQQVAAGVPAEAVWANQGGKKRVVVVRKLVPGNTPVAQRIGMPVASNLKNLSQPEQLQRTPPNNPSQGRPQQPQVAAQKPFLRNVTAATGAPLRLSDIQGQPTPAVRTVRQVVSRLGRQNANVPGPTSAGPQRTVLSPRVGGPSPRVQQQGQPTVLKRIALDKRQGQTAPAQQLLSVDKQPKITEESVNAESPQRKVILQGNPQRKIPKPDSIPTQPIGVRIENLAMSTNETQLRSICQAFGPVENVSLNKESRTAVVKFSNGLHAKQFMTKYQRKMVDLSLITVTLVPLC